MTAQHTPGPWHVTSASAILPSRKTLIRAGNALVADCIYCEQPDDEIEANARLCAAAPELLAIAKTILFSRAAPDEAVVIEAGSVVMNALQTAVAKATNHPGGNQ